MEEVKSLRIKNLEFKKATYLNSSHKIPNYHINRYCNNPWYGKEFEYEKVNNVYRKKDNPYLQLPESAFKNKEMNYAIAVFEYDKEGNYYELSFIGDRPMELSKEELKTFWKIISYGYKELNKLVYEE